MQGAPAKQNIGYWFLAFFGGGNFGNARNGLSVSVSATKRLGRFLFGGAFGVVTCVLVGGVTTTFVLCCLTGVVVVGDIDFSLIFAFGDIEFWLLWALAFCIADGEGVIVFGDVGISVLWAFCMAADSWGI